MRPAARFDDHSRLAVLPVQGVEPRIGVGLKNPGISGEMPLGMDPGPIGRVEEHGCGRIGAAERTIVSDVGPNPPGTGLHLGEHRHGRVIAMDALGGEDMRLDQFVQRHQRGGTGADVIRHGRDRELDPLAGILLALSVERLMVGVLLDQHHRQQAWPGKPTGDRVERRGRLRDRLTRPAAELLPYMLGHEPLPRHHIERLGDVLADLGELGAAAARARGRRRVDDAPARQMIGKVPPRRLAPREAANLNARCLGAGLVLSGSRRELLELQLQLIDKPLAALGARAEHRPLHLGDHQLQVLDHRLGAGQLGARLEQRRLQDLFVVGDVCRRHERDCITIRNDSQA